MHTFCQIVHKETTETNELYCFSTNQESKKEMRSEFCRLAYKHEYKPAVNLPVETDLTNRLLKIFFHVFAIDIVGYCIQSKFSYFKKTIDNMFMSDKNREDFIMRFCKIQRAYWALNRAVYKYKWRKAPYRIQSDLILNPISESQHNVVTILQNNNKYLFTVFDLRTIIEGALSHSPYMFASPSAPKNPYNNIPFDKATLYNIYFFMKKGNFVLSNLFHNYFLCNFNLAHFKRENEVIIRKKYIGEYINHAECDELYDETMRMFSMSKYAKNLEIDETFPKKRLVEIMRPYLRIFFSHIYSLDICERNNAASELSRLLKRFYEFNPQFGRRFIRLKNGRKSKWQYNEQHVEFRGRDCWLNYTNSHLDLEDVVVNSIVRSPSPMQEEVEFPEMPDFSGVSSESESEDGEEDEEEDDLEDRQLDDRIFDVVRM